MADNNSAPDTARVIADGSVTTGGTRAWVWVQDNATGARFDVSSDRLPVPGLTVVDGYPLNRKGSARPAKLREQWETDPTEPPTPSNPPAAAGAKPGRGGAA